MKYWIFSAISFIPFTLSSQIHQEFLGIPPVVGNETSVSINPDDPEDIWLVFNNANVFHSLNGGDQWLKIEVNPKVGFYGDPVVKKAKNGLVYLAHLAKNPEKKWPEWFDCIVFERSSNGVEFHAISIGKNGKMQDKPWFSIDENAKSPYRNNIYLVWTEFDKYASNNPKDSSRIRFAFSEDLGATFSEPIIISDKGGNALDDDGTAEGATIGVLPNGFIYCVWNRNDSLWMDISYDGGRKWGKDIFLTRTPGGWDFENIDGLIRTNGMPFVTVDKKGGLYVVYGARKYDKGDLDIFYLYSGNQGKTVQGPIKINQDETERDQFSPYADFDVNVGYPRVIWYDKRHSETGRFCHVYTAELKKSKVIKESNLSNIPVILHSKKTFYGDYIGFSTSVGGGMAAVTDYSDEIQNTAIAMLSWNKKSPKSTDKGPVLEINRNGKSDSLLVIAVIPTEESFTFEIKSGRNTIVQKVFTTSSKIQPADYQEFYISKSLLPTGLYTFSIRRKGILLKKNVWMN